MQDVGYAALQIIPSFKDLDKNLEAGTSKGMLAAGTRGGQQYGDAAGKTAGKTFGRVFMSVAKVGLVGLTALGVGAFKLGKDSIGLASDLNESLNAVNVSYGEQAKAVKKLGREAAESLGLSNSEFNSLAVQFSAFATTIGGKGKGVVTTLDDLTTRASDFASVMNLDVNEAATLFQSGLAGETEPLRKYGIDLSAAAVEAYALSEGIVKNKDDLTESAKVQARYGLLMEKTSKTQGDFANTSDSLANRQRILSARWDDARAKLGKGLLPVIEDATGFIIDKGLPAFDKFSDWFTDKGLPAIQDFAGDMKPLAKSILPAAGEALGIIADGAKKAAPFVRDLVDGFKDMPDWAKTALVGGGAAAFVGSKLGAGSALGSVVGSLKPVPVFVTNPGFGGGVGPGVVPGAVPKGGPKAFPVPLLGPALALTAGAVANDKFPGAMPFGEKGWAGDLNKYVLTMDGVTKQLEAHGRMVGEFPKRVQTEVELQGVDTSKQAMRDYKGELAGVPSKKDTKFNLMGTEAAKSNLAGVKGWMDSIKDKSVTLSVHTVRSSSDGADFISGGARKKALGGLITGPGGPRDDKIPAMLSNGEYVVNAASTRRYRALLERVNAGHYANGGPVGRGSAAPVERVIEREILPRGRITLQVGGRDFDAYLAGVATEELRADNRFDRAHRRGSRG